MEYVKTLESTVTRVFHYIEDDELEKFMATNVKTREKGVSHYSFAGISSCYMMKFDYKSMLNRNGGVKTTFELAVKKEVSVDDITVPWQFVNINVHINTIKLKRLKPP